jgi:HK97 family phage major capsid protein/HK97 family phage prohead protease
MEDSMPLPNPNKNETEQEFVSRCIGVVVGDGTVDNTPDGRAQASAMCFRQWRDSKKSAGVERAYSLLSIKSFDEEQRVISGMATTPQTDLMEDVVEPRGALFKLPIPFLWQHDSRQPIGHVRTANVTDDGIEVGIQLAKVTDPGKLKDRLDEAWQSIKHGLVRGLSIGFKDLESEPIKGSNWGRTIKKWSWLELSAVTIPANAAASITIIKQIDTKLRAATGQKQTPPEPQSGESEQDFMDRCTSAMGDSTDAEDQCSAAWDNAQKAMPGDTGKSKPAGASARSISVKPKGAVMAKLTITERITNLEATRAANVAALETISQKVTDEGRTKDETEQTEFDDLMTKIEGVDRELSDCRKMEKLNKAAAKPIDGSSPDRAAESRGSSSIISVKSMVPRENLLARAVICKLVAHKEHANAAELARQHYPDTPEVEMYLKAAVAAGTTTASTWATELIYASNLPGSFIEYLWGRTVLSRIPGFTNVPFNVRIPRQTGAVVSSWVGEGASKPVGKLAFDTVTLRWAKCANIVLFTQELAQFSNPAIEGIVRDTLANAIATFIDKQFFDPTVTAVSNVSPASITNGAANDPASGTTIDALINDVKQAFAHFNLFNIPLDGLVWVMEPANAVAIGMLRTTLGVEAFPGINNTGGTLLGFPVFVTPNLTAGQIVLMRPQNILIAQDGGIAIDISTEASVQADSAPATPPTGVVSLWQQNMVGIKAERFITWVKAIDAAVYYITSATYGGVATAH